MIHFTGRNLPMFISSRTEIMKLKSALKPKQGGNLNQVTLYGNILNFQN